MAGGYADTTKVFAPKGTIKMIASDGTAKSVAAFATIDPIATVHIENMELGVETEDVKFEGSDGVDLDISSETNITLKFAVGEVTPEVAAIALGQNPAADVASGTYGTNISSVELHKAGAKYAWAGLLEFTNPAGKQGGYVLHNMTATPENLPVLAKEVTPVVLSFKGTMISGGGPGYMFEDRSP